MSESVALTRRPESTPVTLAVGRILSCLSEAQQIASGMGQKNAITTKPSQPVSRRRETVKRMPWRGID